MALLYLSNLFVNNNVSFRNATNDTEKAISTYSKFKYEQQLLTFEFGLYSGISTEMIKLSNILSKNNHNRQIKMCILLGIPVILPFTVLPFTMYRTLQYIRQNDIKFINY